MTGAWLKYTGTWAAYPYVIGLVRSVTMPRITEPRANSPAGSSMVMPVVNLYSGKIVDVEPSVINVPPASTNFLSSISPSKPMPPRMSSDSSIPPRFGVSAVRR